MTVAVAVADRVAVLRGDFFAVPTPHPARSSTVSPRACCGPLRLLNGQARFGLPAPTTRPIAPVSPWRYDLHPGNDFAYRTKELQGASYESPGSHPEGPNAQDLADSGLCVFPMRCAASSLGRTELF